MKKKRKTKGATKKLPVTSTAKEFIAQGRNAGQDAFGIANDPECTPGFGNYELWLYYKQGDDFADHLREAKGDVCAALLAWEKQHRVNAGICKRLAKRFAKLKLEADGDTHSVTFTALDTRAAKALRSLEADGVLSEFD